jgi:hypothetical protein
MLGLTTLLSISGLGCETTSTEYKQSMVSKLNFISVLIWVPVIAKRLFDSALQRNLHAFG